jgi:ribosomal protein S18 acetylase RimI-like enzyme
VPIAIAEQVRAVTAEQLRGPLLRSATDLYREAYSYAADSERVDRFPGLIADFGARPGFRAFVAEAADGRLAGLVLGSTEGPGSRVHGFLEPYLDVTARARWLDGSFGLAQLAVLPHVRGRGLGGRLHDRILDGLPHAAAVLAVAHGNKPALHLYRSRGWQILVEDFHYPLPHVPEPYAILGLDLTDTLRRTR